MCGMLVLTRWPGETITLSPSKDIDPNMTVGEFFAGGRGRADLTYVRSAAEMESDKLL